MQVGDLVDMHNYVGPGSPSPTATRGAVLGEYGGLGLRVEEHMWIPDDAFAYEMQLTGRLLAVSAHRGGAATITARCIASGVSCCVLDTVAAQA